MRYWNMAANTSLLQFAPFTSTIESGFWHTFTKLKLEKLKLSEEDVPITGYYSNGNVWQIKVISLWLVFR